MKKIYLMKRPIIFQGEKYLRKEKRYFEGWYFKNTNGDETISFIPGINIDDQGKKAFIQIITNDSSYFVNYPICEFSFGYSPFYIKIKDNVFKEDGLVIHVEDECQHLKIDGKLEYSDSKNIKTNWLTPNIMGIFSYVPFMECNHALLSMQNTIHGSILINQQRIDFHEGIGYIEKDWGVNFPQTYLWLEGNHFNRKDASFMLAIADIDFKLFHFKGLIAVLMLGEQEFKFTTYNWAKIVTYDYNDYSLHIVLKRGCYYLEVQSMRERGQKLVAPVGGKMAKDVFESVTGTILLTLREGEKIIFSDTCTNCGLEMVMD